MSAPGHTMCAGHSRPTVRRDPRERWDDWGWVGDATRRQMRWAGSHVGNARTPPTAACVGHWRCPDRPDQTHAVPSANFHPACHAPLYANLARSSPTGQTGAV